MSTNSSLGNLILWRLVLNTSLSVGVCGAYTLQTVAALPSSVHRTAIKCGLQNC
ncbi:hypothetical protein PR003_g35011 [Phytophthora rubi]|uniref:Uncharacterized protein n=1 Tax=Phytophthora rubi TaxID=129364 RepID=A0A6A4AKG0_9STRA|nr:hypothetical protein PR001_g20382 [Phytophthora rubi]KAE9258925.1 hypothetical protein PR003_g35011 [Phytophthora rubi]